MPSSPIPGYNGGTGSPFITFTGPSVARTYTLPDSNITIANEAAVVSLSGSYSDPSWITSLAASKLSGTIPNAVQDNITRLGTIATVYNNTAQPANIRSSVSATQTVNNNEVTALNIWDTSIKDQGSITHSNGVFTVPSAGLYYIFCEFSFPASLTGVREIFFSINGSGIFSASTSNGAASGLPTRIIISFVYPLIANDTVTANAYQTSTVNQACGGGNLDPNTLMMGIIKLF